MFLLQKDIEAALARGAEGRIITLTYQNFTDVESLRSLYDVNGQILFYSVPGYIYISLLKVQIDGV